MPEEKSDVLIRVENLQKYFPIKLGFMNVQYVRAVESATFVIKKVKL